MAKFDFDQYSAQKAARQAKSEGKSLPKTHYMGEFLNEEHNSVIVRFPYTSMDDIEFESVHKVVGTFPNNRYGKWVRCTGNDDCPLCNSANADEKKRTMRFFAKMIVYTTENGKVVLNPTVWDRPSMFADADIKNLLEEYGDISERLFKITRTGVKKDTRYNILPIDKDSKVYSATAYVKDFSSLEHVDPAKILSKGMDKYEEALTGATAEEPSTEPMAAAPASIEPAPVMDVEEEAPVVVPEATPVVEEAPAPVNKTKRYTF